MTGNHNVKLSPEILLQILDDLPTPIFVKDENLRFVFSNRVHGELMGKSGPELLGKSDEDFYSGAELQRFKANDLSVLTTGQTSIEEETASIDNGPAVPLLTRKALLLGNDGNKYLFGTNTDISDLRKREEQHRALAETVPVGILQIDDQGHVTFANPLALSALNMAAEGLTRADVAMALGQVELDFPGIASRFECTVKDNNGMERRLLVISSGWLSLLRQKNRAAIISLVDISENTELKRINEEILRLNQELAVNMQQLKDAQDALVKKGRMEQMGQLTATIAHELRNPLGTVRTSVFLMERKLKTSNLGLEPQMQRINNGIMRCDNIISQLLDFSRTRQIEAKPADLDGWLGTLIEEESRKLPSQISIECELGLSGTLVPFDPGRLQRAVLNLLSNAVEAMVGKGDQTFTKEGKKPLISIHTATDGQNAWISVKDNGPGIAAEMIERVREPLFTTKSFGTGLGIPAIEQIAVQHGGSLNITSVSGEGAQFTLVLPLTPGNQEEAA